MPELWAGTDAGKAAHHCTVIDADGRKVLSRRVPNNEAELLALIGDVPVAPPRDDQQQPQELGQADRDQGRTSFGVGVEDGTFLAAFTAEEVRAPGAVADEALERGARGKVDLFDTVASVQVEVTWPSEETDRFVLCADGSDQRFHAPHLTAH